MRLFMTVDSVGGVWTYALALAGGLSIHGVKTTLAVVGPPPSQDQRQAALSIADVTLLETGLTLDWLAEDEAAVEHTAKQLAIIAAAHSADIVQLNSPSLAALAKFHVPTIGVCHSCLATWWQATNTADLPADFQWRTAMLARGYAACDRLLAPSLAFAAATTQLYGKQPAVVRNAVPSHRFGDSVRGQHVLTAGRLWDQGKNFATLDLAASLLNGPLLAAGPLASPSSSTMPCVHAVALGTLGHDALRAHMQRACIFVSLAVYEPFGLSVLEAAQSGCALVLSAIPTFRELWDGVALFVPAYDSYQAAAVMNGLLEDPSESARLGSLARERAESFSIAKQASEMLALYRGLASSHAIAA